MGPVCASLSALPLPSSLLEALHLAAGVAWSPVTLLVDHAGATVPFVLKLAAAQHATVHTVSHQDLITASTPERGPREVTPPPSQHDLGWWYTPLSPVPPAPLVPKPALPSTRRHSAERMEPAVDSPVKVLRQRRPSLQMGSLSPMRGPHARSSSLSPSRMMMSAFAELDRSTDVAMKTPFASSSSPPPLPDEAPSDVPSSSSRQLAAVLWLSRLRARRRLEMQHRGELLSWEAKQKHQQLLLALCQPPSVDSLSGGADTQLRKHWADSAVTAAKAGAWVLIQASPTDATSAQGLVADVMRVAAAAKAASGDVYARPRVFVVVSTPAAAEAFTQVKAGNEAVVVRCLREAEGVAEDLLTTVTSQLQPSLFAAVKEASEKELAFGEQLEGLNNKVMDTLIRHQILSVVNGTPSPLHYRGGPGVAPAAASDDSGFGYLVSAAPKPSLPPSRSESPSEGEGEDWHANEQLVNTIEQLLTARQEHLTSTRSWALARESFLVARGRFGPLARRLSLLFRLCSSQAVWAAGYALWQFPNIVSKCAAAEFAVSRGEGKDVDASRAQGAADGVVARVFDELISAIVPGVQRDAFRLGFALLTAQADGSSNAHQVCMWSVLFLRHGRPSCCSPCMRPYLLHVLPHASPIYLCFPLDQAEEVEFFLNYSQSGIAKPRVRGSGGGAGPVAAPSLSPFPWLASWAWEGVLALSKLPSCSSLVRDILSGGERLWKPWCTSPHPERLTLRQGWEGRPLLQRMCVYRVLRPDRLLNCFMDAAFSFCGPAFLSEYQLRPPHVAVADSIRSDTVVVLPVSVCVNVWAFLEEVALVWRGGAVGRPACASVSGHDAGKLREAVTSARSAGIWLVVFVGSQPLPIIRAGVDAMLASEKAPANPTFRVFLAACTGATHPPPFSVISGYAANSLQDLVRANLRVCETVAQRLAITHSLLGEVMSGLGPTCVWERVVFVLAWLHATLQRRGVTHPSPQPSAWLAPEVLEGAVLRVFASAADAVAGGASKSPGCLLASPTIHVWLAQARASLGGHYAPCLPTPPEREVCFSLLSQWLVPALLTPTASASLPQFNIVQPHMTLDLPGCILPAVPSPPPDSPLIPSLLDNLPTADYAHLIGRHVTSQDDRRTRCAAAVLSACRRLVFPGEGEAESAIVPLPLLRQVMATVADLRHAVPGPVVVNDLDSEMAAVGASPRAFGEPGSPTPGQDLEAFITPLRTKSADGSTIRRALGASWRKARDGLIRLSRRVTVAQKLSPTRRFELRQLSRSPYPTGSPPKDARGSSSPIPPGDKAHPLARSHSVPARKSKALRPNTGAFDRRHPMWPLRGALLAEVRAYNQQVSHVKRCLAALSTSLAVVDGRTRHALAGDDSSVVNDQLDAAYVSVTLPPHVAGEVRCISNGIMPYEWLCGPSPDRSSLRARGSLVYPLDAPLYPDGQTSVVSVHAWVEGLHERKAQLGTWEAYVAAYTKQCGEEAREAGRFLPSRTPVVDGPIPPLLHLPALTYPAALMDALVRATCHRRGCAPDEVVLVGTTSPAIRAPSPRRRSIFNDSSTTTRTSVSPRSLIMRTAALAPVDTGGGVAGTDAAAATVPTGVVVSGLRLHGMQWCAELQEVENIHTQSLSEEVSAGPVCALPPVSLHLAKESDSGPHTLSLGVQDGGQQFFDVWLPGSLTVDQGAVAGCGAFVGIE